MTQYAIRPPVHGFAARRACQQGNARDRRGFTLIELIISLTIVSLIVLTIMSVDIGSRKFFTGSDYRTRLQNEVSPVLELITRDVTRAVGDVSTGNSGINATAGRLEIRLPDTTYYNYNDNPGVAYEFNRTGYPYQIIQQRTVAWSPASWGNTTVVARNISNCTFSYNITTFTVDMNVIARRFANQTEGPDNPEVVLRTKASPRLSASR